MLDRFSQHGILILLLRVHSGGNLQGNEHIKREIPGIAGWVRIQIMKLELMILEGFMLKTLDKGREGIWGVSVSTEHFFEFVWAVLQF